LCSITACQLIITLSTFDTSSGKNCKDSCIFDVDQRRDKNSDRANSIDRVDSDDETRIDRLVTATDVHTKHFVFGYDRNISLVIMNYIGDIKTLFTVSKVNKLLRETINEEMVIKCAMYSGGRPFASIRNVYRFMKNKSGYIASPLRLLRLCTGKRCEFCNNIKTNDACEFRGRDVSNIRPAVVRPHMNVFACISCLTTHREPKISQGWNYTCLTRKFERIIWSDHKQTFLENGYFLANREILYRIFSHPRVTTYPYGYRWVYTDEDGLVQNAFNRLDARETADRYELQFACTHTDTSGEAIGPLFSRAILPSLVSYLKKPNNRGIDHYLENIMIPRAPKATDYDNFVKVYEEHFKSAMNLKKEKDAEVLADRLYKHHLRVEHVVRAIGVVVSYISPSSLDKQFKDYVKTNSKKPSKSKQRAAARLLHKRSPNRPASLTYKHKWGRDINKQQVFSMVIRTVLCYQEAQEVTLKRPVTYSTGSPEINRIINTILAPLYKDPIRVIGSPSIARRVAKTLFKEITNSADWLNGVSREVTDICGNVRQTFSGRSPRHFNTTYSRKIPTWTDTSDNRNP